MWSFEEIIEINPSGIGQGKSILDHLLHIGATTQEMLCYGADLLEEYSYPNVLCYAQIPLELNLSDENFHLHGWRSGIIDFYFKPLFFTFDLYGKPKISTDKGTLSEIEYFSATQIFCFIRLWGKREIIYERYLSCLKEDGIQNNIVGKMESWMQVPKVMESPAPMTAHQFEIEVARRLQTEVIFALKKFLVSYSIAALEEIPISTELYNYFIMIAPGRVSYGSPPKPLITGFCKSNRLTQRNKVSRDLIETCLKSMIHFDDRVIKQFTYMTKLLRLGEPELALVGCVSALEWYLNETFPSLSKYSAKGNVYRASLTRCIKIEPTATLLKKFRNDLKQIANKRNSIIHGTPPYRTPSVTSTGAEKPYRLKNDDVRYAIEIAFEVYKTVNTIRNRSE